jgi:hypothetical protein
VFHRDRQYIRAEGRIACVGGETPTEPAPPRVTILEPDPNVVPAPGVPVVEFQDDKIPELWLYCGPFAPRTLETDFLASLGGRVKARPVRGDIATYEKTSSVFRPVVSEHFWRDANFTCNMTALDFKGVVSNAFDTTTYYYTVIRNDRPRMVRFRMLTPGGENWNASATLQTIAWVASHPVNGQDTYSLPAGHFPLLIQVSIGTTKEGGRIWAAPRFTDITAVHEEQQRVFGERLAAWNRYKETIGKPPLLSASGISFLE